MRPNLENLESRRVPSVSLVGRTLHVIDDGGGMSAIVTKPNATTVRVNWAEPTTGSHQTDFRAASVSSVEYDGGMGFNSFRNETTLSTLAFGGNDTNNVTDIWGGYGSNELHAGLSSHTTLIGRGAFNEFFASANPNAIVWMQGGAIGTDHTQQTSVFHANQTSYVFGWVDNDVLDGDAAGVFTQDLPSYLE